MSYGIIRIQKFKAQAVRGIQSHDKRERESHSNPDIEKARSELNYDLVECSDFKEAIKERLDTLESTRAVRKDAVVMVQCLVTSGPEFFQNMPAARQREFFEQSLVFIADRYGKENILSATVHMDEKTPHMHVNLTPIKEHRLTAYELFKREELRSLHTDFHRSVGKPWGLNRGESREEKTKHLDSASFKLKAREKELDAKQAELDVKQAELKAQLQAIKDQLGMVEMIPEGIGQARNAYERLKFDLAYERRKEAAQIQEQEKAKELTIVPAPTKEREKPQPERKPKSKGLER